MSYAIAARFPLMVYRGAVGQGEHDPWPSPARLHAAFLAAAARGTSAVERGGVLEPCDEDVEALEWLETHPPDGLVLPAHSQRPVDAVTSYRSLGLLQPKMRGVKRPAKRDRTGTAVAGEIMWVWGEAPPRAVHERLEALCSDVPYLGDADSPVRLHPVMGELPAPTHRREERPSLTRRPRGAWDMPAPRAGRTSALRTAFDAQRARKAPTISADKATTDESENRDPVVTASLGQDRYTPEAPETSDQPWQTAWIVPLERGQQEISPDEQVGWCVAAHRALISIHGDDAPPVLTGVYAEGAPRPTNRVAIHVIGWHEALSPDVAEAVPDERSQALVIAMPRDADPRDVEAVHEAVRRLAHLAHRGRRLELVRNAVRDVDATRFWSAPPSGTSRTWNAEAVVAETRPPRGGPWTLADAATYSTALVFRDRLEPARAGSWDARIRALAAQARDRFELRVSTTRRLMPERPERYAHRTQPGLIVDPYRATLSLGALADDARAFVAIGQSRHLGGGLLTPTDAGTADEAATPSIEQEER